MIEIKRINTQDSELYNYMESLLETSFPDNEYRALAELREYTDSIPEFYNNIIFNDGIPVGLITYWHLGNFYYVEHFAIDPNQRNGGYGRKVLNYLAEHLNGPIVLEVETPTDEMSKRRINFYQREGFSLWEKEYFQPPYKSGDDLLPMFLMATDGLNAAIDFDNVKRKIHKIVYNYTES